MVTIDDEGNKINCWVEHRFDTTTNELKGGFRGNVNTDSRKKESQNSPFFRESAGARTA